MKLYWIIVLILMLALYLAWPRTVAVEQISGTGYSPDTLCHATDAHTC